MVQAPRERKPMGEEIASRSAQKATVKKSYVSPRFVEYGSVTKLTQSGTTSGADLFRMRMPCL
jgi:hypothetical protein